MYEIDITPEARKDLNRLSDKVYWAILDAIFGLIARNPHRAGKRLLWDFEGLHSARRSEYRIIYEILDSENTVVIHRVDHRRSAYRPR